MYDYAPSTYGIALAGNATRLRKCTVDYISANRGTVFKHVAQYVHAVKVSRSLLSYFLVVAALI